MPRPSASSVSWAVFCGAVVALAAVCVPGAGATTVLASRPSMVCHCHVLLYSSSLNATHSSDRFTVSVECHARDDLLTNATCTCPPVVTYGTYISDSGQAGPRFGAECAPRPAADMGRLAAPQVLLWEPEPETRWETPHGSSNLEVMRRWRGAVGTETPCVGPGGELAGALVTQTTELTEWRSDEGHEVADLHAVVSHWNCTVPLAAVDCETTPWSDWNETCSDGCGENGYIERTRSVVAEGHGDGAAPCGNLTETRPCNRFECPMNCTVTAWSGWSPCSSTCDGGTRRRTRAVALEAGSTVFALDGSRLPSPVRGTSCDTYGLEEFQPCSVGIACAAEEAPGVWSNWEARDDPSLSPECLESEYCSHSICEEHPDSCAPGCPTPVQFTPDPLVCTGDADVCVEGTALWGDYLGVVRGQLWLARDNGTGAPGQVLGSVSTDLHPVEDTTLFCGVVGTDATFTLGDFLRIEITVRADGVIVQGSEILTGSAPDTPGYPGSVSWTGTDNSLLICQGVTWSSRAAVRSAVPAPAHSGTGAVVDPRARLYLSAYTVSGSVVVRFPQGFAAATALDPVLLQLSDPAYYPVRPVQIVCMQADTTSTGAAWFLVTVDVLGRFRRDRQGRGGYFEPGADPAAGDVWCPWAVWPTRVTEAGVRYPREDGRPVSGDEGVVDPVYAQHWRLPMQIRTSLWGASPVPRTVGQYMFTHTHNGVGAYAEALSSRDVLCFGSSSTASTEAPLRVGFLLTVVVYADNGPASLSNVGLVDGGDWGYQMYCPPVFDAPYCRSADDGYRTVTGGSRGCGGCGIYLPSRALPVDAREFQSSPPPVWERTNNATGDREAYLQCPTRTAFSDTDVCVPIYPRTGEWRYRFCAEDEDPVMTSYGVYSCYVDCASDRGLGGRYPCRKECGSEAASRANCVPVSILCLHLHDVIDEATGLFVDGTVVCRQDYRLCTAAEAAEWCNDPSPADCLSGDADIGDCTAAMGASCARNTHESHPSHWAARCPGGNATAPSYQAGVDTTTDPEIPQRAHLLQVIPWARYCTGEEWYELGCVLADTSCVAQYDNSADFWADAAAGTTDRPIAAYWFHNKNGEITDTCSHDEPLVSVCPEEEVRARCPVGWETNPGTEACLRYEVAYSDQRGPVEYFIDETCRTMACNESMQLAACVGTPYEGRYAAQCLVWTETGEYYDGDSLARRSCELSTEMPTRLCNEAERAGTCATRDNAATECRVVCDVGDVNCRVETRCSTETGVLDWNKRSLKLRDNADGYFNTRLGDICGDGHDAISTRLDHGFRPDASLDTTLSRLVFACTWHEASQTWTGHCEPVGSQCFWPCDPHDSAYCPVSTEDGAALVLNPRCLKQCDDSVTDYDSPDSCYKEFDRPNSMASLFCGTTYLSGGYPSDPLAETVVDQPHRACTQKEWLENTHAVERSNCRAVYTEVSKIDLYPETCNDTCYLEHGPVALPVGGGHPDALYTETATRTACTADASNTSCNVPGSPYCQGDTSFCPWSPWVRVRSNIDPRPALCTDEEAEALCDDGWDADVPEAAPCVKNNCTYRDDRGHTDCTYGNLEGEARVCTAEQQLHLCGYPTHECRTACVDWDDVSTCVRTSSCGDAVPGGRVVHRCTPADFNASCAPTPDDCRVTCDAPGVGCRVENKCEQFGVYGWTISPRVRAAHRLTAEETTAMCGAAWATDPQRIECLALYCDWTNAEGFTNCECDADTCGCPSRYPDPALTTTSPPCAQDWEFRPCTHGGETQDINTDAALHCGAGATACNLRCAGSRLHPVCVLVEGTCECPGGRPWPEIDDDKVCAGRAHNCTDEEALAYEGGNETCATCERVTRWSTEEPLRALPTDITLERVDRTGCPAAPVDPLRAETLTHSVTPRRGMATMAVDTAPDTSGRYTGRSDVALLAQCGEVGRATSADGDFEVADGEVTSVVLVPGSCVCAVNGAGYDEFYPGKNFECENDYYEREWNSDLIEKTNYKNPGTIAFGSVLATGSSHNDNPDCDPNRRMKCYPPGTMVLLGGEDTLMQAEFCFALTGTLCSSYAADDVSLCSYENAVKYCGAEAGGCWAHITETETVVPVCAPEVVAAGTCSGNNILYYQPRVVQAIDETRDITCWCQTAYQYYSPLGDLPCGRGYRVEEAVSEADAIHWCGAGALLGSTKRCRTPLSDAVADATDLGLTDECYDSHRCRCEAGGSDPQSDGSGGTTYAHCDGTSAMFPCVGELDPGSIYDPESGTTTRSCSAMALGARLTADNEVACVCPEGVVDFPDDTDEIPPGCSGWTRDCTAAEITEYCESGSGVCSMVCDTQRTSVCVLQPGSCQPHADGVPGTVTLLALIRDETGCNPDNSYSANDLCIEWRDDGDAKFALCYRYPVHATQEALSAAIADGTALSQTKLTTRYMRMRTDSHECRSLPDYDGTFEVITIPADGVSVGECTDAEKERYCGAADLVQACEIENWGGYRRFVPGSCGCDLQRAFPRESTITGIDSVPGDDYCIPLTGVTGPCPGDIAADDCDLDSVKCQIRYVLLSLHSFTRTDYPGCRGNADGVDADMHYLRHAREDYNRMESGSFGDSCVMRYVPGRAIVTIIATRECDCARERHGDALVSTYPDSYTWRSALLGRSTYPEDASFTTKDSSCYLYGGGSSSSAAYQYENYGLFSRGPNGLRCGGFGRDFPTLQSLTSGFPSSAGSAPSWCPNDAAPSGWFFNQFENARRFLTHGYAYSPLQSQLTQPRTTTGAKVTQDWDPGNLGVTTYTPGVLATCFVQKNGGPEPTDDPSEVHQLTSCALAIHKWRLGTSTSVARTLSHPEFTSQSLEDAHHFIDVTNTGGEWNPSPSDFNVGTGQIECPVDNTASDAIFGVSDVQAASCTIDGGNWVAGTYTRFTCVPMRYSGGRHVPFFKPRVANCVQYAELGGHFSLAAWVSPTPRPCMDNRCSTTAEPSAIYPDGRCINDLFVHHDGHPYINCYARASETASGAKSILFDGLCGSHDGLGGPDLCCPPAADGQSDCRYPPDWTGRVGCVNGVYDLEAHRDGERSGSCVCDEGWSIPDDSEVSTSLQNRCVKSTCTDFSRVSLGITDASEIPICSHNGECVDGACKCARGFGGQYCDLHVAWTAPPHSATTAAEAEAADAAYSARLLAGQALGADGRGNPSLSLEPAAPCTGHGVPVWDRDAGEGRCDCYSDDFVTWSGDACDTPTFTNTADGATCVANGGALAVAVKQLPDGSYEASLAEPGGWYQMPVRAHCKCGEADGTDGRYSLRAGRLCEHRLCPVSVFDSDTSVCSAGRGTCAYKTGETAPYAYPRCRHAATAAELCPDSSDACISELSSVSSSQIPFVCNGDPRWGGCACETDRYAECIEPARRGEAVQDPCDAAALIGAATRRAEWVAQHAKCTARIDAEDGSLRDYSCECPASRSGTYCEIDALVQDQIDEGLRAEPFGTLLFEGDGPCNGEPVLSGSGGDRSCGCQTSVPVGGVLRAGEYCQYDTSSCGSVVGSEIVPCSGIGTCVCQHGALNLYECQSEWICECPPANTGEHCELNDCPNGCGEGVCTPGLVGEASAVCACNDDSVWKHNPGPHEHPCSGASCPCTLSGCDHEGGATPQFVDGEWVCACNNPLHTLSSGCTREDCPVDTTNGAKCGTPYSSNDVDPILSGGCLERFDCPTAGRQCNDNGFCVCSLGYTFDAETGICVAKCHVDNTISYNAATQTCGCLHGYDAGAGCRSLYCPTHVSANGFSVPLPQPIARGDGTYTCGCPHPFSESDRCLGSHVCVNGVPTAESTPGGVVFSCACVDGFDGVFCESTVAVDPDPVPTDDDDDDDDNTVVVPGTEPSSCFNGGEVVDGACVCVNNFAGERCTENLCVHGTYVCNELNDEEVCACVCSGDGGYQLDPETGACTVLTCGSGGSFVDGVCRCTTGYTLNADGSACHGSCANGGVYDVQTDSCECVHPFVGIQCTGNITELVAQAVPQTVSVPRLSDDRETLVIDAAPRIVDSEPEPDPDEVTDGDMTDAPPPGTGDSIVSPADAPPITVVGEEPVPDTSSSDDNTAVLAVSLAAAGVVVVAAVYSKFRRRKRK